MFDCPFAAPRAAEVPFDVLMRAGAAARRGGDRVAALALFRAAAAAPDHPGARAELARELRDLGHPA